MTLYRNIYDEAPTARLLRSAKQHSLAYYLTFQHQRVSIYFGHCTIAAFGLMVYQGTSGLTLSMLVHSHRESTLPHGYVCPRCFEIVLRRAGTLFR